MEILGFLRKSEKKEPVQDDAKVRAAQAVAPTRDTWFKKIASLFEGRALDEGLWDELEELLIAADVGLDTTGELLAKVKERVRKENIRTGEAARSALKEEMVWLLSSPPGSMTDDGTSHPWVVLVVGVNGVGKTTSIAKLARFYQREERRVLLAAGDTFRAAAIDQLKVWGEKVGADVISHQPGADPGAVAFDAVQAAKSRGVDVVIIDTAGRLHTKFNLMEEMKKVHRAVAKAEPSAPHQVLLVMDATTGQNGLAQARSFTEAVGITGIFLAKLDGTAKGGVVLAVCRQLGVPVVFVGTGEGPDDLAEFHPEEFVEALFA